MTEAVVTALESLVVVVVVFLVFWAAAEIYRYRGRK